MALTDAKRRANNKYIAANMTTLGCKMRKDRAAEFKAACAQNGTTPNAVFTAAAQNFLAAHTSNSNLPDRIDPLLTPSAMATAETAAASAGEDVMSFLERAISTQAALDLEHLRESRSESRSASDKVAGSV